MRAAKIVRTTCLLAALGPGMIPPATSATAPPQSAGINGVWMTEHADAKIRIAACGKTLCGTIVWLAEPNDASGQPKTDVNNSDEAKRARPLMGLIIFTALTPDGQEWRGRVYNSENGRDYDVEIGFLDEQHAFVKGCVLGGLICGSETWTRTEPPEGRLKGK
ncbi:DUF2147 domain-containing protein [Methylocapsa sp. S129]|uniref:DUF2147 domain-containing protein n=1 Tax=Methylocapsa sp. S129 TaxID=1641869 RepID=UPI00131C4564|nr:DUF2147 domain-containing protein [Methylocapsa sp. S129]